MTRLGWLAVALGWACSSAGSFDVAVVGELPPGTAAAVVYAVPDASCPCGCGGCADRCGDGRCVFACGGAPCPVEARADLAVDVSPGPGRWALVFDLLDERGALIGSACASLDLDADGAADRSAEAVITGCP